MLESESRKSAKGDNFRITKFSRRQFLKSAVVVAAGAAIGTIPAACKTSDSATSTTPYVNTGTTAATSATTSSPASVTSTASVYGYAYVPPAAPPPLITVAGTCTVATDRQYSTDHIWVKSLPDNNVVMGITVTMHHLLSNPSRLALSPVGTTLAKGDSFGTIQGFKLTSDLITPVSGTIIGINSLVIDYVGQEIEIAALTNPYQTGWMVVIQLSKPAELNSLLSAQEYAKLVENV